MSWTDAFAPIEAHYRAQIDTDTWGHLAPHRNARYHGVVEFAVGIFGDDYLNPMPIRCEFKSRSCGDLESSPWFYDTLMEFLQSQCGMTAADDRVLEAGVYRFTGHFHNYVFSGTIEQLQLTSVVLTPVVAG